MLPDAAPPPESAPAATPRRAAPDSVSIMEWTPDVADGDWIRERLDPDGAGWGSTMHAVVPRGFEAYARIFHPASRDRPVGTSWPPLPYARHRREWDEFAAADHRIDEESVTWSAVAEAFGTTFHAGAQWPRLVGIDPLAPHREDGPRDAAGWRYSDPAEGELAPAVVSAAAAHLAAHTSTPDEGRIAVWEGWGGLLGFFGTAPARAFLQAVPGGDRAPDPVIDQHNAMLGRSIHDPFNRVFTRPSWQPGILPDEVSHGPRLSLPARDHVLFRGGVSELADPDWVLRAPWRDRDAESHGFSPSAASPSLVWPVDRAWVMVTEVDYDSTIVGGSAALVTALCADPRLEALPIREGTVLGWDADALNS